MTPTVPPYRRIAEKIRQRIAAGELRPGDRVPSARQITREYAVAIATATRVHAALRQDGLTEVRPGVGTVVAGSPAEARTPARRRPPAQPALTRERIVRTAIAMADADGLAELSMRRLATRLDVATMSVYQHVPGKNALILAMIDAACGEQWRPAVPPAGWRERLRVCADAQWRLFRRHPWLAPTMSLTRPQLAPNALVLTEWVLAAFEGTRVPLAHRMYVHIALFSFLRGIAVALEPETEAERDTGLSNDEWMHTQERQLSAVLAANPLPHVTRLIRQDDFDLDLDRLVQFGLDRFLDGLAPFVDGSGPA